MPPGFEGKAAPSLPHAPTPDNLGEIEVFRGRDAEVLEKRSCALTRGGGKRERHPVEGPCPGCPLFLLYVSPARETLLFTYTFY